MGTSFSGKNAKNPYALFWSWIFYKISAGQKYITFYLISKSTTKKNNFSPKVAFTN